MAATNNILTDLFTGSCLLITDFEGKQINWFLRNEIKRKRASMNLKILEYFSGLHLSGCNCKYDNHFYIISKLLCLTRYFA